MMYALWTLLRTSRTAQIGLMVLTALAGGLILVLAFQAHQRSVAEDAITLDRADISAEVSNKVIAADRAATANAIERDAIADINDKELSHEADRADGNAVESVLERMRRQQAAGRR